MIIIYCTAYFICSWAILWLAEKDFLGVGGCWILPLSKCNASESLLQAIDKDVRKEVDEAVKRAKTDPELPVEELYTHVYKEDPEDFEIRGCDAFTFTKAN